MVVVLLQRGRAKPGSAGKSRWNFIGIAAEAEICEFELEPVPEDNNISRFNVPVHVLFRFEVCSHVDKFNNKPDDNAELVEILLIQQAMLKRVLADLEQQSGLVAF